jgi:hypothetical protein
VEKQAAWCRATACWSGGATLLGPTAWSVIDAYRSAKLAVELGEAPDCAFAAAFPDGYEAACRRARSEGAAARSALRAWREAGTHLWARPERELLELCGLGGRP